MIGERLGDYEIIASLGKGGFGSVWKAIDSNGTPVAIKVLNHHSETPARQTRPCPVDTA